MWRLVLTYFMRVLLLTVGALLVIHLVDEVTYGDSEIAEHTAVGVMSSPTGKQQSLSEYVLRVMDVCGAKHTAVRKHILSRQIARVASEYLPDRSVQEAYVGLLCIESRFDPAVTSPAGAVGIAQVMPKYVREFSEQCGLGTDISQVDVRDAEVGLVIGACHFRHLLAHYGGNLALALAAYNSGQGSLTTRKVAELGTGHPETMSYIARYYALTEALRLRGEEGTR